MSDTVLRVRDLGKRYRLGEIRPGIRTFREALVQIGRAHV